MSTTIRSTYAVYDGLENRDYESLGFEKAALEGVLEVLWSQWWRICRIHRDPPLDPISSKRIRRHNSQQDNLDRKKGNRLTAEAETPPSIPQAQMFTLFAALNLGGILKHKWIRSGIP